MTARDDRVHISAEIPSSVNEALEAEKDRRGTPKWKIITDGLRLELGLDAESELAGLQRRIQRLEDERAELEDQREATVEEISEIDEELARLRDEKERIEENRASFEETLDEILAELEADRSKTAYAFRSELRSAATLEYGQATEETISEVVEDLRDRASEIGAEVREEQFENWITGRQTTRAPGSRSQQRDNLRFVDTEE